MKTTKLSFYRAVPIVGLLLALSGTDVWAATTVAIYPGSHAEQQTTEGREVTTIYVNSDSYAKIDAFYKSRYRPNKAKLDFLIGLMKGGAGRTSIPRAAFIVDGSSVVLIVAPGKTRIVIVQRK